MVTVANKIRTKKIFTIASDYIIPLNLASNRKKKLSNSLIHFNHLSVFGPSRLHQREHES